MPLGRVWRPLIFIPYLRSREGAGSGRWLGIVRARELTMIVLFHTAILGPLLDPPSKLRPLPMSSAEARSAIDSGLKLANGSNQICHPVVAITPDQRQ